jgi:hypothetical protein
MVPAPPWMAIAYWCITRKDIKLKAGQERAVGGHWLNFFIFDALPLFVKYPRTAVLAWIIFVSLAAPAQKGYKWEFGVMTGVSNYLGEIGGTDKPAQAFVADLKLSKTRWNESIYLRYKFHPMFAVKGSFNYLRIEGDDALTDYAPRKYRNLSFRNDIFDVEAVLNWYFYSSDKPTGIYRRTNTYFTAYLLFGAGGFYHNPKTYYQGQWVALQPLKTEGQLEPYSRIGLCVPFGGGFYVTITQRRRAHRIGFEFSWRYTNTDYLDDIRDKYASPRELSSRDAVALSNRNPEVARQPEGYNQNYGWWDDGAGNNLNKAPRGDKSKNDSYLSFNITYGIAFKTRYYKNRSRGRKIRSVLL